MDIYTTLKKDHDKVKYLLSELVDLENDDSYREVLIDQIAHELIPHSRAEESVLYNSIRAVSSDNSDIMHSFKEHIEVEGLLRALQLKDSTDMDWKSTAFKLQKSFLHHVSEEEGKIFSEAKKIFSETEASMMGSAFEALKSKASENGFVKNSIDMVVNLMPPRFVEKVKSFGSNG